MTLSELKEKILKVEDIYCLIMKTDSCPICLVSNIRSGDVIGHTEDCLKIWAMSDEGIEE